ncbi:hypothetical protein, conserved [Eimeria brunetti]|uniref:Uncharacterized protein n=1 Tax=Eimeria brunetti TaxID=51314 RepID=U6LYE4_9EIME|nr:hypothetical protein, conserved [Eimeria brunetti]
MAGGSTCSAPQYYTIGDVEGVPVDVIIADGLAPGSYLTEDEKYHSDAPGINAKEFVTQCKSNGVEPVISCTAGRDSRRVEVVILDGPEPRRYLWKERCIFKREEYTDSGRSATKVSIQRIVKLGREVLKPPVVSGVRHRPDTAVYCTQICHSEEGMTRPSWNGSGSTERNWYATHRSQDGMNQVGGSHLIRPGAAGSHYSFDRGEGSGRFHTQREPAVGNNSNLPFTWRRHLLRRGVTGGEPAMQFLVELLILIVHAFAFFRAFHQLATLFSPNTDSR